MRIIRLTCLPRHKKDSVPLFVRANALEICSRLLSCHGPAQTRVLYATFAKTRRIESVGCNRKVSVSVLILRMQTTFLHK